MIYEALNVVAQELNTFLKMHFQLQDNPAVLGTILDETGAVPENNQNKIILSLVNLEHDTNYQYNPQYVKQGNRNYPINLPYNFNLDVLITALFTNYSEALKFLSQAIYFFQSKNVFNAQNTPGLDPQIQQLSFEVVKLSYHETHSLWTAMGAKYMPSVLFKVRMLSFQSDQIQAEVSDISSLSQDTKPSNS